MKKIIFFITGLLLVFFISSVFIITLNLVKTRRSVYPSNSFKDCGLLADSCKDKSCQYFFLCNVMEFTDCKVYDCEDKYGVLIKDKQGEINQRIVAKPDQTKVAEMVNRCRGSLEILDKKECEEGQARAKVKLVTKGDCKVSSFIIKIDGKNRIAKFEKKDGFYYLSVDKCGEISKITAVGEGGIPIK